MRALPARRTQNPLERNDLVTLGLALAAAYTGKTAWDKWQEVSEAEKAGSADVADLKQERNIYTGLAVATAAGAMAMFRAHGGTGLGLWR